MIREIKSIVVYPGLSTPENVVERVERVASELKRNTSLSSSSESSPSHQAVCAHHCQSKFSITAVSSTVLCMTFCHAALLP